MIENFNNSNLDELRRDIDNALKTVTEKHGLKNLTLGNIRYTPEEFSSKITGSVKSALTEREKLRKEAEIHAGYYGIDAALIGKEIESNGKLYVLDHFKPNNKKYPVICSSPGSDGLVKMTAGHFKMLVKDAS